MNDIDRAGECRGAKVDRRRTAQHLDAFDVDQVDDLKRRQEDAADLNAIDQHRDRREPARSRRN